MTPDLGSVIRGGYCAPVSPPKTFAVTAAALMERYNYHAAASYAMVPLFARDCELNSEAYELP